MSNKKVESIFPEYFFICNVIDEFLDFILYSFVDILRNSYCFEIIFKFAIDIVDFKSYYREIFFLQKAISLFKAFAFL